MFSRHKSAKVRVPEPIASGEKIEAAERFYRGLKHRYEIELQSMQGEIGAFYRSGQVMVRVSKIELLSDIEVLMLTGVDENGHHVKVSGYYKSMDVMFHKVEPSINTSTTRVDFGAHAA